MKPLITLLLALAANAYAITYELSTRVSGGGSLGMTDIAADFHGTIAGQAIVTFGNLNSTIYYDPVAQTMRQVGSIPLLLSDNPIVLNETRQTVSGVVTIDQAIADTFAFDSGIVPLAFDSATHARLNGTTEVPFALTSVHVDWSLASGGQTLADSFDYLLSGFTRMLDPFFQDFTFASDLSSILMPGLASTNVAMRGSTLSGNELTTDNGFNVRLLPGIGDFTDNFSLLTSPVVAIATPDTGSTLILLGLSVAGLFCYRRRTA